MQINRWMLWCCIHCMRVFGCVWTCEITLLMYVVLIYTHACIIHEMLEVCLCAFIAVRKFLVWVCRFCSVFVLIGAAAWVGFNEPQPWPSPPPLSVRFSSYQHLAGTAKTLISPSHKTSGYFCSKSVYSAFSSHIALNVWAKCVPSSAVFLLATFDLDWLCWLKVIQLLGLDHRFTCYRPAVRCFVTFRHTFHDPGQVWLVVFGTHLAHTYMPKVRHIRAKCVC